MSDANRQSMTDKAGAAIKPDSQKGYVESATDGKPCTPVLGRMRLQRLGADLMPYLHTAVKGTADSIASTVMPESQKVRALSLASPSPETLS